MTAKLTIRNIRARPVLVPFKRPIISASGGVPSAGMVLIDLETEEGITGRSYLFGYASWTLKPIVSCLESFAAMIKGDACAPYELDAKLRRQLKLLDTPGLVGIALSGIDMVAGMRCPGRRSAGSCSAARSGRFVPTTAAACGSSPWRSWPTRPSSSLQKAASPP
jgi:mandelate racemase